MSKRIRNGFTFSIPKELVAMMDTERELATRSAYLSSILAEHFNMNIEQFPYPGQKFSDHSLDMEMKESLKTPEGVNEDPEL